MILRRLPSPVYGAGTQTGQLLSALRNALLWLLPWISYEADDRLSQRIVRSADMRDGGGVVMTGQPHHGRRFPPRFGQAEDQFGAVYVDQRILEFRPGNERCDTIPVDVMHGGITVEPRGIGAVILFDSFAFGFSSRLSILTRPLTMIIPASGGLPSTENAGSYA